MSLGVGLIAALESGFRHPEVRISKQLSGVHSSRSGGGDVRVISHLKAGLVRVYLCMMISRGTPNILYVPRNPIQGGDRLKTHGIKDTGTRVPLVPNCDRPLGD